MLLSVSPAMTFYLSHLVARIALPKASQDKPSSWQTFFVNAAGNATSTAILFPLILSKTRLQWRSPSGRKMYKSLLDVLRKTVHKYGFAGEISSIKLKVEILVLKPHLTSINRLVSRTGKSTP